MNRRSILRLGATTLATAAFTALPIDAQPASGPTVAATSGIRFDHVSLNVRAFDRMMAWYRDVLGFRVEVAWRVAALDGKRLAYLVLGDTRLELVEADPDGLSLPAPEDFRAHFARTGYGHLCLAAENIDALMAGLAARGVPSFVRPETYDLDGTPYRRRVGFIKDPEGNVLEFAEPLIGA
ncbi:MAG: VOC family protein [Pseudomonadota bacterium]